ncbi:helix-turn-helix domain-containing protein [Novosphingobium sp. 9]|uniref:helix-turn-helix domain-containing protein n=1 Tax=Novosphingobium sp. 9 TaxID=2025349 RepID=UPI0021B4FF22|nr:helix-turn-helix transcriptional regulator [Novosphingobium sp. 9]
MKNRIRDIRQLKSLTLAEVAAACSPPTTAQTIGRLETGMRNLSLDWMNRIAAALDVEPEMLLASESAASTPRIVADLTARGAQALAAPREAILPGTLVADAEWLVVTVTEPLDDHRPGDQIWLRRLSPDMAPLGREVLVPLPGERFAYGRLFARDENGIGLLPLGRSAVPTTLTGPTWIAVAEMLVRKL